MTVTTLNISTAQRGLLVGVLSIVLFCSFIFLVPDWFLEKPCGDCNSVPENFLAGKGWVDDSGNFAYARPPGQSLTIIGLTKLSEIVYVPRAQVFIAFNILLLSCSASLLF